MNMETRKKTVTETTPTEQHDVAVSEREEAFRRDWFDMMAEQMREDLEKIRAGLEERLDRELKLVNGRLDAAARKVVELERRVWALEGEKEAAT